MPPVLAAEIPAKISRLFTSSLNDLRSEWTRLFDEPAPKGARQDYLARAIAYRLQTDLYGGMPPALLRRLKRLYGDYALDPEHAPAAKLTFKPGTRILREWQGEMHEAIVLDNGFLYHGQTYKSLSVIARKITGTRWSGPLFFGVKTAHQNEPECLASSARKQPPRASSIKRLKASQVNAMAAGVHRAP